MEWPTFDQGIIWGQSIMLVVAGWFMADAARILRRQTKVLLGMDDTAKEMLDIIYFQKGVITALQAGVVRPGDLVPIDFSNLPIEIRLKILYALIDVGVTCRHQSEATT